MEWSSGLIDKIIKRKYIILGIAFFLIIFFPVILNFSLLSWRSKFTFGDIESWIGFFGNYSGALLGGFIGAIVALIISGYQANEQKQLLEKQILEQRKILEIKNYQGQLGAVVYLNLELQSLKKNIQVVKNMSVSVPRDIGMPLDKFLETLSWKLIENKNWDSHIEKIIDVQLQKDLWSLYHKLLHAEKNTNQDISDLESNLKVISANLPNNILAKPLNEVSEKFRPLLMQYHEINSKLKTNYIMRNQQWRSIIEDKKQIPYIVMLLEKLNELENEIENTLK